MRYKAVITCKQGVRFRDGTNPCWEFWGIETTISTYDSYVEAMLSAQETCDLSPGSCWNPRVEAVG